MLLAWHRADATVVDDNAGRILAAIDDLKLKNDTIAVFTSDHGYGSGPLEPAVRIPLMLRYRAAETWPAHVAFWPRTSTWRRRSWRYAELAPAIPCKGAISCANSPNPSIVSDSSERPTNGAWWFAGWTSWWWIGSQNVTHLYNLGEDPLEMDNRARDPGLELKRNELKALLNDWMRRTGDGMDPSGLKLRAGTQATRAGGAPNICSV